MTLSRRDRAFFSNISDSITEICVYKTYNMRCLINALPSHRFDLDTTCQCC